MMNKILLFTTTSFLILFLLYPGLTKDKSPKWVRETPRNPLYYVGIGFSSKADGNYREVAVQNALSNLAKEISTDILSKIDHEIEEASDEIRENITVTIQTSSREYLEGYENVDEWQNESQFWVYYRLSKEKYAAIKKKRLTDAKTLALDFFDKGTQREELADVAAALSYYLQALTPLEHYFYEPLDVDYAGVRIVLPNEIQSSLSDLVSRISLTPEVKRVKTQYGRALEQPFRVNLSFERAAGNKTPAVNLPVRFEFVKGSAEFVSQSVSDRHGTARSQVTKITSSEPFQIVEARLDFNKLIFSANVPPVYRSRLNGIPTPSTQFFLEVAHPAVYVRTEEFRFGIPSETLIIEPELKNALLQSGFTIAQDISHAEIEIFTKAISRKTTKPFQGFYTAWVDLVISVSDVASGREIYKNSFKEIKGIRGDYDSACVAALQKAASKLQDEIVPLIVAEIFH